MSLTIAIATAEFAVMSGDYRRVNVGNESEFYDDTPKAFHITDHVLIGITGDLRMSIELRTSLNVNKNAKINAVVRVLEKALATAPTDAYCSIILAGKDNKGRMKFAQLSHETNFKARFQTIKPGEIKWLYAYSFVEPGELIEREYEELNEVTCASVSALARKVNEEVAETDARVSRKCDVIYIT
ncbi:hypothetical protein BC6307_19330 [Sutcliffiella cohnii]|uniref:Uncharacterized protein n=1 Tax=Sutcliffiella cohnii TaxID=33932 RepID=A0A223KUV2_9BACI|nr:hypothetical protein [Sutcliffiella cohnii]AST93255.1 hypothetical protein BC6307_19330 [Sutcliffiella cohnii]